MTGNSFGNIFKITTFGESHNKAMGVIIDGVPSNLEITAEYIQKYLDERRPAQSKFTSPRGELDKVEILSGIYENKTLGTPICLIIYNQDQRSKDYSNIATSFRPSHGDFTWYKKYHHVDKRGGGRSSARETVARVAAAAIAYKILEQTSIQIIGYVKSIGELNIDYNNINYDEISNNSFYSPDKKVVPLWENLLLKAIDEGDSYGSVVEIVIKNCPIGLGEPVFNKLNATLAHAIFSIPAVKGLEFGEGFNLSQQQGSIANDTMLIKDDKIHFNSNNNGGIIAGISNGEDIILKIAIKPTSSIAKPQQTINENLENTEITIKGRHDPCIGIRAVSVCKAMCAIVLCDSFLQNKLAQHKN